MFTLVILIAVIVFELGFLWWASAVIYRTASNPDEVNREYFSICPPNKIIIIMDGANPRRYVSNVRGFDIWQDTGMFYFIDEMNGPNKGAITLDLNTGKIERPERFDSLAQQTFTSGLDKLWGVHWLGLPPMGKLFSFDSEWNDVAKRLATPSTPNHESDEDSVDFGFKPMRQRIASLSMVKNYGWMIPDCETGRGTKIDPAVLARLREVGPDLVAIDIYIFSTVVIVNAYKAFILTKWTEGVNAVIRRVCTTYCQQYNTDSLGDDAGAELMRRLWLANIEIMEKYGVAFYHLEYNGWDYSGTLAEKKEIREISRTLWKARKQRDAAKALTDAAAYDIERKGTANATAITAEGTARNAIRDGKMNGFKILGDQAGAAALAEGMGDLKPGVTLALGGQGLGILAQPGKGEQPK